MAFFPQISEAPDLELADSDSISLAEYCSVPDRDPVVAPQKVFEPSKPSPNTFSEGTTGSLGGMSRLELRELFLENV